MSKRSRNKSRGYTTASRRHRLTYRYVYPTSLLDYEDNRRYNPERNRRLRRFALLNARRISPAVTYSSWASMVPRFELPKQVVVCVRRKTRREVLFARGGAGRRKMRKPHLSPDSNVQCRR